MPVPISLDLRRRIVAVVEGGSSVRAAARRFAVSPSTAVELLQRVRATGSPAPARHGGYRRPLLEPHEIELRQLVSAEPDLTLAELQERVKDRVGLVVGRTTLPSRTARTSRPGVDGGEAGSPSLRVLLDPSPSEIG